MRGTHTVVKKEGRSAEYNYCRISWQTLRAVAVTAKGEVRKYVAAVAVTAKGEVRKYG
jgi:hypothetical protein